MALFHFSEDPEIPVFRPHIAKTSAIRSEALVWPIDGWHSPMYRYTMPEGAFSPAEHGGGHYVSRAVISPLNVEPMGDLLAAIGSEGVELRITPRLGPMWKQIWSESTLAYSGTRLRNAQGYPTELGVSAEH